MAEGENQLIEWLRARFPADSDRVVIGIGDDAAAVRLDGSLVVVTTDMLLDTVHFDTADHTPEQIGRKAIACSLSDCAAMACRPRAATVSIAFPRGSSLETAKGLAEGMASIADAYGCAIVGGDTTSWAGRLAIDIAMLAEPMAGRGPVRRSDARPGDIICVSGPLGGSILGRHLTFTPRIELASRLVREPALHAMMDISDGLALDLYRMCHLSECDAILAEDQLRAIVSDAARALADRDGRAPLAHALTDGEDFELLVAADAGLDGASYGLHPVGRMAPRTEAGVSRLFIERETGEREPLEPGGYQHL